MKRDSSLIIPSAKQLTLQALKIPAWKKKKKGKEMCEDHHLVAIMWSVTKYQKTIFFISQMVLTKSKNVRNCPDISSEDTSSHVAVGVG